MLIRLKSSSLGLVVIGSTSMPVCNCFHGRLANIGEITTFRGYHSLMPSCAGSLEPRRSRLGPLKFTFNAENFMWSLSWSICSELGAIRCWNVSRSPKLPKKSIKPLFWHSRSSNVIEFSGNREPVYDFLLVTNNNLGPISHRYWDTSTYWPRIANFATPLSFSALVRGDPLRIPETRVFRAADGENLVILACAVFDWSTRVTDGRTDRQTERIAMAKTRWKQ